MSDLSRRDFLKIGSTAVMGFFLSPLIKLSTPPIEQQGRVIDESIKLFDQPSLKAKVLETFWKDMLLSISEVTIGDEEPSFTVSGMRFQGEDMFILELSTISTAAGV